MSPSPWLRQSIPTLGLFSLVCLALASATASIGQRPLLSAKAVGIYSKASAKALIAYCSTLELSSAFLATSKAQASSADPPP